MSIIVEQSSYIFYGMDRDVIYKYVRPLLEKPRSVQIKRAMNLSTC